MPWQCARVPGLEAGIRVARTARVTEAARSTRRRVCIIAPEFVGPFPNGGVGTACYWEASVLGIAGLDTTVLYTGPTDRGTAGHWERTYRGAPFTYVDLWRTVTGRAAAEVNRMQQPCAEARTAELVSRYLKATSFDLLLFQEFLGHGARALQARRSGDALSSVPAAVTLHSCRQWIYEGMQRLPSCPEDMYVDFLERESARLADSVIAPSHHMANWAATHWRHDAPASVVPYCYDRTLERPATCVRHAGPFTHLVFFGRLETRKGLHLFCRALAAHGDARGPVDRVTFLGKPSTVEDRPSREFIRHALAELTGVEVTILDNLGSLEALAWLEQQRRTLVVAPSLVDNLPYAVIELFSRRIPFIATRIGGIPEIVGPANGHLLADASTEGLAAVLDRVHREGTLEVDYGSGYSVRAANAAHVAHVQCLLDQPARVTRTPNTSCRVVVVDADPSTLPTVRDRFVAADSSARDARFFTWTQWRDGGDTQPAIFVSSSVTPCAGLSQRLLHALSDARVQAATAYYASAAEAHPAGQAWSNGGHAALVRDVAPLGGAIECGWMENVFGGPCFAAGSSAIATLRRLDGQAFRFWPAYAAMIADGMELALVPERLFEAGAEDRDTFHTATAVLREYHAHAPRLDLGWILKYARGAAPGGGRSTEPGAGGRALYDQLLGLSDSSIALYAGLSWSDARDPLVEEIRALRRQLAALAARWHATDPRVFVYGAGQHTRLILTLEPELGPFIAGFIDRRPVAEVLGRPCIRPEDFSAAIAEVVLYSSREHECDMHAQLASVPVEHVLLYTPRATAPAETTATRVRRRFGHAASGADTLRAMYRPPSWTRGVISGGDAEFLLELVTGIMPRRILELGVASGTSAAALLCALDQLDDQGTGRELYSCDVRSTCYFDAQRAVGAATREMYPHHRARWVLNTDSDARRISRQLDPASIDLVFIDANHCHPWPLLDLLHVTTVVKPGSWIALHDIALPRLHPQFQVYGPQWLFRAWPFNKIHGIDGSANIGAVQLPADLRQLLPMAHALLDRPWEHVPTSWDIDLPEIFGEITTIVAPRLASPVRATKAG
jgi:glycosyltransferase involved in cell wall biosynthesis/predicted O-methyltransferase YrrM